MTALKKVGPGERNILVVPVVGTVATELWPKDVEQMTKGKTQKANKWLLQRDIRSRNYGKSTLKIKTGDLVKEPNYEPVLADWKSCLHLDQFERTWLGRPGSVLLALLEEVGEDRIVRMGQRAQYILQGNVLLGLVMCASKPEVSNWLSLGYIGLRSMFCFASTLFKNINFKMRKWRFQIKLTETSQDEHIGISRPPTPWAAVSWSPAMKSL